jgi:hypothetical protein
MQRNRLGAWLPGLRYTIRRHDHKSLLPHSELCRLELCLLSHISAISTFGTIQTGYTQGETYRSVIAELERYGNQEYDLQDSFIQEDFIGPDGDALRGVGAWISTSALSRTPWLAGITRAS